MVAKLLLACFSVRLGWGTFVRAEIQTCSGCKLYALPEVKMFIIDESKGALSFERVSRKIIRGQNPDIVLYSAEGTEVQRIDMTPHSFSDLVGILEHHGFKRPNTDL